MSPTDQDTGDRPVAGTAARRAKREAERRQQGAARAGASGSATDRLPAGGDGAAARRSERARRKQLDPDTLAALEEERDFLLRSLDDLEREHAAGDVDDDDYESLRDDYTVRAADVLRAIEGRRTAIAENRRPRSDLRTVLVGAGVVLFAIVLGIGVTQASGRRGATDTMTGGVRATSRDVFFEARELMNQGQFVESIEKFDEALASDPAFAEAHMWKGWVLRLAARGTGSAADQRLLFERAHESLSKAIESDPDLSTAYLFRASVNDELGRGPEGLADLDKVRPGTVPEGMEKLQESLRTSLERRVAAGGGTPTTTTP